MDKKLMFVSGAPRSGTSALVNVLNTHPDFLIGMERYFFLISRDILSPAHFEKHRFVDVRAGDTHGDGFAVGLEERLQKYDQAKFIGDKHPLLYQKYDHFFRDYPEAIHIYIVRNPISLMESYNERFNNAADKWKFDFKSGLCHWNESVLTVNKFLGH